MAIAGVKQAVALQVPFPELFNSFEPQSPKRGHKTALGKGAGCRRLLTWLRTCKAHAGLPRPWDTGAALMGRSVQRAVNVC